VAFIAEKNEEETLVAGVVIMNIRCVMLVLPFVRIMGKSGVDAIGALFTRIRTYEIPKRLGLGGHPNHFGFHATA